MEKTWRVYLVLTILSMAVLLFESPALAQSYRDKLPRSSVEMNQMLLTYARGNRHESVEALLPLYEPLLEALKSKFGQDVKSDLMTAITSQNASALLLSAQRLVHLDIMDFLDLAKNSWEESPEKTKVWLQAAQFDYSLLSPFVQNNRLNSDLEIRNLFREATQLVDVGPIELLGSVLDKISMKLEVGLKKTE